MTKLTLHEGHLCRRYATVELDGANDNEIDERSVTVASAALRLGCNQSTVRDLVRNCQLSGHRVGKGANPTGIRIKMWSIKEYEQRFAVGLTAEPVRTDEPSIRVRRRQNAADDQAAARLKAIGA
jgi:hypothetical protein